MHRLTRQEKKKKLIKTGGKLLSRANRAWKRGDMKDADKYTKRFHTIEKRKKESNMQTRKQRINKAFKDLGRIDKSHESGRITKKQHDTKSRAVLRRLVR